MKTKLKYEDNDSVQNHGCVVYGLKNVIIVIIILSNGPHSSIQIKTQLLPESVIAKGTTQ